MKRNKYLEEIGLDKGQYGLYMPKRTDKRRKEWKIQRKEYGFDERETWNLNGTMAEWIYSHLMMFTEIGGKTVDLNYNTFEYNDRNFTLYEAIEYIKDRCREYLLCPSFENDEKMTDALHLLAVIFPALWW